MLSRFLDGAIVSGHGLVSYVQGSFEDYCFTNDVATDM